MKSITYKFFYFLILFFITNIEINGQVFSLGTIKSQYSSNNAFMDAATNFDTDLTGSNINGKGFVFPRTDLTSWVFLTNDLDDGYIPTSYDGMIVYNTGTGNSPSGGNNPTTSTAVTPGFYYFSNPTITAFDTPSIIQGEWKPLGSEGSPKIHITENTPTETNLVTVDATMEKVISITGTADGITTHMDLGTTVLPKDTVINFRKAIICDSTGTQVLVATGSYDTATNKFVTGNGMMNYCLPAATNYKVELYYTSN